VQDVQVSGSGGDFVLTVEISLNYAVECIVLLKDSLHRR